MSSQPYIFPQDEYWLGDGGSLNLLLNRSAMLNASGSRQCPSSCSVTVKAAPSRERIDDLGVIDELNEKIGTTPTFTSMNRIRQLGLKDFILGLDEEIARRHTRESHSIGSAIVGRMYLGVLTDFLPSTKYAVFAGDEKLEKLLLFALYLHDIAHLPFSHLMEEVYNELNWTRIASEAHRHDEAALEQLDGDVRDGIGAALENALISEKTETTTSEAAKWYEFVKHLVAGSSGIPFLDAIVNSAIDADKIDYVFRDVQVTRTGVRIRSAREWLTAFLANISLSPEGMVRLDGEASLCALELLSERQYLYETLYLAPRMRVFERLAACIIVSWLTRVVPTRIYAENALEFVPDLRVRKGQIAYNLLLAKYLALPVNDQNELTLLMKLCDDLSTDPSRDQQSREWFSHLKSHFEQIGDAVGKKSVKDVVDRKFQEMLVGEPIYVTTGGHMHDIREIVRSMYVDFPCQVLVDVASYPKFRPTPAARHFVGDAWGETFLVPDADPQKWSKSRRAAFPLHRCNFERWERNYAQLLVVSPIQEVRGEIFYDHLTHELSRRGIDIVMKV